MTSLQACALARVASAAALLLHAATLQAATAELLALATAVTRASISAPTSTARLLVHSRAGVTKVAIRPALAAVTAEPRPAAPTQAATSATVPAASTLNSARFIRLSKLLRPSSSFFWRIHVGSIQPVRLLVKKPSYSKGHGDCSEKLETRMSGVVTKLVVYARSAYRLHVPTHAAIVAELADK
jgi:hypothetical protein